MIQALNMGSLGEIDGGRVGLAYESELAKVIHDLENRAADDSAREIVIKVKMNPVCDDSGELAHVSTQVFVHSKMPIRRTAPSHMRLIRDDDGCPSLFFNDGCPEDSRQHTIDEITNDNN